MPPSRRGLVVGLVLGGLAALVVGVILVAVVVAALARPKDAGPRSGIDHWHAAYGVYLCDRWLAPVQLSGDRGGIHSHGDGIVHVEPSGPVASGRRATFGRFEEAVGLLVTSSTLRWVDGFEPVEARTSDGCGGQEAEIVSFVDGVRHKDPPGRIRLRDGQVIVVALVPKGTPYERIGGPPSESYLPKVRGLVP